MQQCSERVEQGALTVGPAPGSLGHSCAEGESKRQKQHGYSFAGVYPGVDHAVHSQGYQGSYRCQPKDLAPPICPGHQAPAGRHKQSCKGQQPR